MSYIEISPIEGWYEQCIEDFCDNISPYFGLSITPKDVHFSGFWSQGDGASFTGNFYLSDVSSNRLKVACPTEVELHDLVEELQGLANEHPEIQGKVTRLHSLYSHSNTMVIGDWSSDEGYCNEETENFAAADAETALLALFRQLADWLYNRLEEEYNFLLADATAYEWAEAIEEREVLQLELGLLQVDVAENPPKTRIQSNAISSTIEALEIRIETLTAKINQLADQFHFWPEGSPISIKEFYENYL